MKQVLVRRGAIKTSAVREGAAPEIGDGQIVLAVESFSVTANNSTYAAMGDAMRYWDFFPAAEGFGIVPVWGHARVVESRAEGLAAGERIYGYLPMATHLVVTPGAVKAGSFTDTSPHRAHLAAVYNQYRRLAADPAHDPAREGERMVFEPLFMTSFLIFQMFARENWFGAKALAMTSASSKTAMALAHVTKTNAPEIERIGLTSKGNAAFVRGTGLYDRVLAYEDIASIAGETAVSADFAGNGAVLRAVHEALGEGLRYSCLVGLTHWEERGGAGELPGPKPVLFFAPDHVAATVKELGPDGFAKAVAASWGGFVEAAGSLVRIERVRGLEEAAKVFTAVVEGTARADVATVVEV